MKKNNKKWTKPRHKFIYGFLKIFLKPLLGLMYGFKTKKYKLDKKQGYFIISNHQALLDPLFVAMTFNKPIYFVATDNLFNQKFKSSLLKYFLAPIPKRKGTIDVNCLKICLKVAKENGSVGLFVEGNRAYSDFQFYIDPSIIKLVRKMNVPVILYNLKGGFGVDPRWGSKKRKGKFTGEVKRLLSIEEIKSLSDEELYKIICDEIKVFDSSSIELYKSKQRAEYLERQFFVCPKCNSMQTIYSKENNVYCSNCDLEIEYTEDLKLKSKNNDISFNKLVDWYIYQLEFIKNYEIKSGTIFEDDEIEIYYSNTNQPRKLIQKGKLVLTDEYLQCGNYRVMVNEIETISPVGGFKFVFSTNKNNYIVKGHKRFNPLKYVLFFNILEGPIKERGGDKYYGFDIY